MRIKRVEIIGFKSFCDRAVIQIGASEHGVTGIVGPNGCGKSNIVDAIRWCMGEQSAKHLRGKAMEDIIFAGSESRGPAPMAEVSLTFDDVGFSHETLELARHSDEAEAEAALAGIDEEEPVEPAPVAPAVFLDAEGKAIPSATEEVAQLLADQPPAIDFARYTEVTITRRLYRDGTSQYFINKTPCRLRDITDFFLGTGVGTKAYAIIEQGRIGQIVSSRPQDRRAIIEEAAGITKFKAKKKAAERKLDQTRQNLMRVSDIVSELDKRMGTLRRQAQKAERYRKYKGELRDIELWKGAHRWLELTGEDRLITGRLAVASDELGSVRTAWTVQDAHVVAERAELGLEERRLVGIQNEIHELDNRVRLGESKIGFERREAEELDARIASCHGEIAEIVEQRERGAAELAERTSELGILAAEVERETLEVTTREATVSEARQMLANAQGRLDDARAELGSRRTEIATATTELDALTRRRDEASRRLERVLGETEQHTERVKELDREGKKASHMLAELRQTRLDLGSQSDHFEARRDLLADDVARGEAQVETLRSELHRRRSRLASLLEIQERYEGFQRGTRAVMTGTDSFAGEGIRGVVADVVRAPETLEVAVEAALGDRLGGILVSGAADGIAAIGFLKQGGAGRSAFVPMTGLEAAPPAMAPAPAPARFEGEGGAASWMSSAWHEDAEQADRGASAGKIEFEDRSQLVAAMSEVQREGVLGRMADMVTFTDGYEGVGKRLMGGTVVVDHLERALALHQAGVTDRLVTLEGDVIDPDGVVAGGSREAQGSGVLAQKRESRELEEIVARLEHELAEATAALLTARTEQKQVHKAIEGLRTQAHEGDLAIIGHEKDETRVRHDLERHRDRLGQLGGEQLELDSRLAAIAADDAGARGRRQHAEDRIAELEREQLEHISEVTMHRDRLEELAHVLTEARIRAAQLGEKRAAAESAALRLANVDLELVARTRRLEGEIAEALARATELRDGCERLAGELAEVSASRSTLAGELADGRTAYDARFTALTEVELTARELRSRADTLHAEVGQLELRHGQVAMTRQVVEDGIAERYQLEVPAIVHEFHQRAPIGEVEEARLTELRDLLERMGTDINLTAIDEFAEVSTRFEFLSSQRSDLERAVDQLQRAIDKINKTSRKLFKDTFNAVNATFREVFPRLFRGGQAFLSLAQGPEKAADGAPAKDVDLLEAGIEIFAQPPGKKNTTVDQLSGGEKALTAVALVFSIFLIKPSPFCILDEVDAPLDEANVDRYNELVREMTDRSQFIVITHNKRTMEAADNLYGVTMKEPGVSMLVSVNLSKLGRKPGSDAAAHVSI